MTLYFSSADEAATPFQPVTVEDVAATAAPFAAVTRLMDMSIGALVKTGPAIVLMLVALMMLNNR
jgi:hypothetical protein